MKNEKSGKFYQKSEKKSKDTLFTIIVIDKSINEEVSLQNYIYDKNSKQFSSEKDPRVFHIYEIIEKYQQ
jgi:hypothetical protein